VLRVGGHEGTTPETPDGGEAGKKPLPQESRSLTARPTGAARDLSEMPVAGRETDEEESSHEQTTAGVRGGGWGFTAQQPLLSQHSPACGGVTSVCPTSECIIIPVKPSRLRVRVRQISIQDVRVDYLPPATSFQINSMSSLNHIPLEPRVLLTA